MNLWFPIGFSFGDGYTYSKPLYDLNEYQILKSNDHVILVVKESLINKWTSSNLLNESQYKYINYGNEKFYFIDSKGDYLLQPVNMGYPIIDENDIKSFVVAIKHTRDTLGNDISLADGIFVEKYSLVLPSYSLLESKTDDAVIGYWVSGGVEISSTSTRRLAQLTGFSENTLAKVLNNYDIQLDNEDVNQQSNNQNTVKKDITLTHSSEFILDGRPELESFFNEHVIDIIRNRERYQALGIGFPSAVILHGPPGCGKTYAVEQLVNFLDWPSYRIEASSVASPYIHETSKKVAEVFETAIKNSPSVLIIDEMEAFLSNRDTASSNHNIEEMAEFLRRIPEATSNDVLIVAMTNKIDMIDPAILRRGRFDHILKVDYASVKEIESMIKASLQKIATEDNIDIKAFAEELKNRPLSDVAFFIKEGARVAAKNGKDKLDNESLDLALESTMSREQDDKPNRMGFI